MAAAARLLRERGIRGASVADLMAAAGLTHGGFYGHFASKDALVAAACADAYSGSVERWKARIAGCADRDAARTALIDGYLSPVSRASPGTSCPTAALAADVAREPPEAPVRDAFREGLEQLAELLASVEATGHADHDRRQALGDLSTMMGALLLARATAGHAISDELLAAGRERLVGRRDGPPRRRRPADR
jgi:TetR/AcrR family transcriptional repressor of nem operon